jgi:excisionase family DNA binding protein
MDMVLCVGECAMICSSAIDRYAGGMTNQSEEFQRLSNILADLASTITEIIDRRIKSVNRPFPESKPAVSTMLAQTVTGLPQLAFTMKETAEILGVSYITVHRLLQRWLLRSTNTLRHKIIPRTEIERFLKSTVD